MEEVCVEARERHWNHRTAATAFEEDKKGGAMHVLPYLVLFGDDSTRLRSFGVCVQTKSPILEKQVAYFVFVIVLNLEFILRMVRLR